MVGTPPNVSWRVGFEVCRPMFTSRELGVANDLEAKPRSRRHG